MAVVHLGSHLRRTCSLLLLPLPRPYFPGLLSWEPPGIPCLPSASHAFLVSLLWSGASPCLPSSLYRESNTPGLPPEPRLCGSSRTSVFSTQRSVRAVEGARPRTNAPCLASLGCLGLCLPPLLQVLPPLSPSSAPQSTSPHPNSRCSGFSSFLLGVGSVATPTREPRNGHAVDDFQRCTPVKRDFSRRSRQQTGPHRDQSYPVGQPSGHRETQGPDLLGTTDHHGRALFKLCFILGLSWRKRHPIVTEGYKEL